MPLPDIKGRVDLLSYYMKDKPFDKGVDAELLARQTQGGWRGQGQGRVGLADFKQ